MDLKSVQSQYSHYLDKMANKSFKILKMLQQLTSKFDVQYKNHKPSQLVIVTLVTVFAIYVVANQIKRLFRKGNVAELMRFTRNLPIVKTIVDKKLKGIGDSIRKDLCKHFGDEPFIEELPTKPSTKLSVLGKLKHYRSFDSSSWQAGRISGTIYSKHSDPEYRSMLAEVYGEYMWSNPLHADVFAAVRKMEVEIVKMATKMYRGNHEKVVGCVTSGGTESIIMACKAYRNLAINEKNLASGCRPEFVVPVTAHAAFEKAANFLNCDIKFIPVDKETYKVDLKLMEAAISSNTCLLVGSAPQFPHGIIDPIIDIAKLGLKKNIPVHVDACLGGFLLPFMEAAGYKLDEQFDFTVNGVTSISADSHKYGYAPKGTSILMYSDKKYIHEQYSIQTDWPGGVYASPTIPGSRAGGLIATCWAAMLYHGLEGYIEATRNIMQAVDYIKAELGNNKIVGLRIIGKPYVSVLAFTSDKFNILMLNDKLKDLGWNLNALQYPPSFHLCVTQVHSGKVAENFVRDIKTCTAELMAEPSAKPAEGSSAAMYGMCQTISDRSIVAEVCKMHLDACLGR